MNDITYLFDCILIKIMSSDDDTPKCKCGLPCKSYYFLKDYNVSDLHHGGYYHFFEWRWTKQFICPKRIQQNSNPDAPEIENISACDYGINEIGFYDQKKMPVIFVRNNLGKCFGVQKACKCQIDKFSKCCDEKWNFNNSDDLFNIGVQSRSFSSSWWGNFNRYFPENGCWTNDITKKSFSEYQHIYTGINSVTQTDLESVKIYNIGNLLYSCRYPNFPPKKTKEGFTDDTSYFYEIDSVFIVEVYVPLRKQVCYLYFRVANSPYGVSSKFCLCKKLGEGYDLMCCTDLITIIHNLPVNDKKNLKSIICNKYFSETQHPDIFETCTIDDITNYNSKVLPVVSSVCNDFLINDLTNIVLSYISKPYNHCCHCCECDRNNKLV